MNPWFVWKGMNSLSDWGLWINKLPDRKRPEERHEEIEIPGRSGTLIMLEGEDIFSSYTTEMIVVARDTLNISGISNWLRGSSDLILSTETSKAVEASIVGEVSFSRTGNNLQQATIPLLCKPFRKSVHPTHDRLTYTTSGYIYNPGDVASKPKVSITCANGITVSIAGQAMTFLGVNGDTIVVDCDSEIVTKNGQIWTGSYSGEFWKIQPGNSSFARSETSTIVIDPNWRWF